MARKRRRRPFPWTAWLWFLAMANLAAGFALSPTTSVRKVRVVNAPTADHRLVESALETLQAVPAARVDAKRVESMVMAAEDIDLARLRWNIFGRAVLRVEPKLAVATLAEEPGKVLGYNGEVFMSKRPHEGLPVVRIPRAGLNACLFASWESREVARLCQMVAEQLPNMGWSVAVDTRGVLSLRGSGPCVVVLGSRHGLPEKIEVLSRLMEQDPELLDRHRELNLTSPDRPVVVPRT